jgi:hypothetical protein
MSKTYRKVEPDAVLPDGILEYKSDQAIFKDHFDAFVIPGDTITAEHDGFTLTARIDHDDITDIDDYYQGEEKASWLRDEWHFSTVVIAVARGGYTLHEHAVALSGVDRNFPGSDNTHLRYVANELAEEAIALGHTIFKELCEEAKIL